MTRANRHYARFIPREEVGDVRHWDFGDVHGADALRPLVEQVDVHEPEPLPAMDDAQHQALVQQAHDEGHARGLAEGREQARLEWQQRMDEYVAGQGREAAARLARLAQAMEDSLAGMQQGDEPDGVSEHAVIELDGERVLEKVAPGRRIGLNRTGMRDDAA